MISTPPDYWGVHGENNDKRNKELLSHKHDGSVVPYEKLLEEAGGRFDKMVGPEQFKSNYDRLQNGVAELRKSLQEAKPDAVIVISDDQDEILFDDNMPMFSIYWGETAHLLPNRPPATAPEPTRLSAGGYGDVEMDLPIDSELGLHLIEYLADHDFDISHSRYMKEEYGGSIGPAGYVWWKRETAPRPKGIGHGFSFVVKKFMDNKPMPMVPVTQNTCYPPNQPRPKRSYALGKAIADAVKAWDANKTVAVIGSGGLSHFVLDEELDRLALKGMMEKNAEILCSLPRQRLQSATSEILNWVAASAASEHLNPELIDYVPSPRTPAGTGGGWGFMRWT
jgi:3-O-methylgallate 3,4-dioxygenase